MNSAIHHLAITASSLTKSKRFYNSFLPLLGYKLTLDAPSICAFSGQSPELLIYRAERKLIRSPKLFEPGWHHCAFLADSEDIVVRVFDAIKAMDGVILDPPGFCPEYAKGYFAVYFLDPDGLKLEVAHIPNEPNPH